MAGIGDYKKGKAFTLKSGNNPSFKNMGSTPVKYEAPRDESMEPTGPRDESGSFETKGGYYSPDVKTKPKTRKTSTGKDMPTGETEVKETVSNRYKKDGKTYSTVRGPSAEKEEETSIVDQKGKQKGKTRVVHSNPETKSDFLAKDVERDDSNPFSGERTYDPKSRSMN
tara:strand:+ start:442 stop:948 length:507 start_codon:yes stop_codon:yes gene_type:complete